MSDRYGLLRETQSLVAGTLRIADPVIVAAAGVAAYWLRLGAFAMPFYIQATLALGVVLSVNFFQLAQLYRLNIADTLALKAPAALAAWAGVCGALTLLVWIGGTLDWYSRAWAMSWAMLAAAGLLGVRVVVMAHLWRLRERGRLRPRVAVVGARALGQAVVRQLLLGAAQRRVDLAGVFDDLTPLPTQVEGVEVRGTVDDLVLLARRERVDEVVLATLDRSAEENDAILAKLRQTPLNVKICAHSRHFALPVRDFTALGGLPLLHIYERPLAGWGGVLKALEDRVLGVLILILAAPAMLAIALAIKLDSPGPVLFRQKRYGFNNNEITVYKFRSMRNDPNPDPTVPQARKSDPRITKVGGFIRRTSLDELPQIFNVLKGEMSLVGPRPHAVAHNEHFAKIIDDYLGRHRVKPGITGWAQVHGYRGETDTDEKMRLRVQHDLYYIDHWSLMLDVKILLLTLVRGFVHKNAY